MNQKLADARKAHEEITGEIDALEARKAALAANRKEAFDRRETLRAARVKATVDGTEFADDGELAKLAEHITVFDEAIGVLDGQLSAFAGPKSKASEALRYAEIEDQLYAKVAEHVALVAQIEVAARQMAAGLQMAEQIAREMSAVRGNLPGVSEFTDQHVRDRLGGRIGRALSAAGFGGRLGMLTWTPEQLRPEDWAAEESAVLCHTIDGSMRLAKMPPPPTGDEITRALIAEDRQRRRLPVDARA